MATTKAANVSANKSVEIAENSNVTTHVLKIRDVYEAKDLNGNTDYKSVLVSFDGTFPAIIVDDSGEFVHGERDVLNIKISTLVRALNDADEDFRFVVSRQRDINVGKNTKFSLSVLSLLLAGATITIERVLNKAGETYEVDGVEVVREFDSYFTNVVAINANTASYKDIVTRSKSKFLEDCI